jgi:hypothetical protein
VEWQDDDSPRPYWLSVAPPAPAPRPAPAAGLVPPSCPDVASCAQAMPENAPTAARTDAHRKDRIFISELDEALRQEVTA